MSRPWMPLYIADYLKDTTHLGALESGAYLHLIMDYWQNARLPDDDKQLARIAKLTDREWKKAKLILQAFFQDGWHHKRIDAEIAKSDELSNKRRAAANQRHSKEDANAHPIADANAGAIAHTVHSTPKEDRIGDARVRGQSWHTEGSKALAEALWKALGVDNPAATPPELAGVMHRSVEWERAGWTPDLLAAVVRRIGPGKPLNYYEKAFASEYAKRQAPLPVVEIAQPERMTVNAPDRNGRNGIGNALERAIRQAESFDSGGAEGGENTTRLLSHG